MGAVGLLMRVTRKRRYADPDGAEHLLGRPKGPSGPPDKVARRVDVSTEQVTGFDVHSVRRPGTPPGTRPVVVHLHGGAYVNEIVAQHWDFVADLALELDVEVLVPIYGLAPQHTAAEARALCEAVLDGVGERPCWLAGDSSGAGLALVAAQARVRRGAQPLRGLTLLAPWLDLAMGNPELDAAEARDPWLARAALREVARVWADGTPLDDGLVSPLFGEMAGLPPVDLWVGTRDLTHPDTLLLAERLRAARVDVTLHEARGAIHVFPLLPVPEGRAAARAIRARIADGLDAAG